MDVWGISTVAFGGMLGLMALGLPLAFSMLITGGLGIAYLIGPLPTFNMLGQLPMSVVLNYDLSVAPMFILMGAFVNRARLSHDLYDACHSFLGHLRGGLAMATIVACGGFAAVSGSSIASAATMSKVAMPQMRRYGYDDALATGTIASGGTLGIIIPPSINLVLYGIMTGTDIGKLFIAGIFPGAMTIILYIATIWIVTAYNPNLGPRANLVSYSERFKKLKKVSPIGLLFILIISGIYIGLFTPTEAGSVGAFGALMFGIYRRAISVKDFFECLIETAKVSAMLLTVLIGATFFSNFLNLLGLPTELSDLVINNGISPVAAIVIMIAILAVLGCILETLSMLLLMVPIFFPITVALGFNPIWFGILFVMVMELGLISPPIGLNLFIIKSIIKDVSMATLYRGIIPFIVADIIRILIIIWVPGIVLFLPLLGK